MWSLTNYHEGDKCHLSTNDPFWKYTKDVDFKIQTSSQEAKNLISERK